MGTDLEDDEFEIMRLEHDTGDGPGYTLFVYGIMIIQVTSRFLEALPDAGWRGMLLKTDGGTVVELLDIDWDTRAVTVKRYNPLVYVPTMKDLGMAKTQEPTDLDAAVQVYASIVREDTSFASEDAMRAEAQRMLDGMREGMRMTEAQEPTDLERAVARAICRHHGVDPDALEPHSSSWLDDEERPIDGTFDGEPAHFLWREQVDLARAVMAEVERHKISR